MGTDTRPRLVAHQLIGDAVPHGIDIDERIMRHAPAEALLTPRQGTHR